MLRNPDFVRLWVAETISQFGTQISLLALPLVAISLLNASAFEVAALATIEFLPFILFSLPAGAWVDRLRRRPILIVGDLGRAVALATIPIAYALGALTIWQLYVVGFVAGTLTVFFDVAYQSYLPSIVDRDQLVDGNGKLETSRTIAQTAGPALGGGLIGLITAPLAVLADALSFVVSAVFLFAIRRHEPTPDRHADEHGRVRGNLRQEVADGLRYVLGNEYLRGIAASTATFNLFSNVAFATFLVFAVRELGLSPAEIGIVFGLGNFGAIVGALSADRLSRRFGVGRTIVGFGRARGTGHHARRHRPGGVPGAVPCRQWLPDRVRRGRLQHQPGELPPGDHANRHAGSDERHDALHRVGHDPDRVDPGRHDRDAWSDCARPSGSGRSGRSWR